MAKIPAAILAGANCAPLGFPPGPPYGCGHACFRIPQMKTIRAFVAPRNSGSADPRSQSDTPQVIETADRAGRMVAAAAREDIYHGRCLDKSLVLWWLLLWRHLPAEIHIGVRQTREKFEARAWVELFGSVINDTDALHQEYIPFGRDITKLGIQSH